MKTLRSPRPFGLGRSSLDLILDGHYVCASKFKIQGTSFSCTLCSKAFGSTMQNDDALLAAFKNYG